MNDPYEPTKLATKLSWYLFAAIVVFLAGFFVHANIVQPNCPVNHITKVYP